MSETAQGGIVVICGLIVFIYGILRWVIWGYKKDAKFIEKAKKMDVQQQQLIRRRKRM